MHRLNFTIYEQNKNVGWTRIDLILALYDGILSQLERARTLLERNNPAAAGLLLARARIGIGTLAAGNTSSGELGAGFLRLYEFIMHCLAEPRADKVVDAIRVLHTLQEGFQAVRKEAQDLERAGVIPALDRTHALQVTG